MTNATIDYVVASVWKKARDSDESGFKCREKKTNTNTHTPTNHAGEHSMGKKKIASVFEWPINIAYFTKH